MAAFNNVYEDIKKSLGYRFEDEVIARIDERFVSRTSKMTYTACSGTSEDTHEGVDFKVYGVKIDITYNLQGKNNTFILPESIQLDSGYTVRFGVRIGNSYRGFTRFREPVLVIGVEGLTGYELRKSMVGIVDSFMKLFDDIIDVGQAAYWDYLDANQLA